MSERAVLPRVRVRLFTEQVGARSRLIIMRIIAQLGRYILNPYSTAVLPVRRGCLDTVCTPHVLDELSEAQDVRKRDSCDAVCDVLLISPPPDSSS